jgi:hypothetical protein
MIGRIDVKEADVSERKLPDARLCPFISTCQVC